MRRCGQLAKENDAKAPNVLGVGSLNLGDASMCAFPARVRRRGAAVEGPRTLTTRPRAQVPAGKDRCRQQSVDADTRAAARHRRGLRAASARHAAARQQPHPAPRHRALLLTSVPSGPLQYVNGSDAAVVCIQKLNLIADDFETVVRTAGPGPAAHARC